MSDLKKTPDNQSAVLNELFFNEIINTSFDGYVFTNPEGIILNTNLALANMLGFENPDEVMGRNISEFVSEEDLDSVRQKLADCEGIFEYRAITRTGETIIVEIWGKTLSSGVRVTCVRDVTESRLKDEALRDAEERYRELLTKSFDGIAFGKLIFDPVSGDIVDFLIEEINPGVYAIYGEGIEQLLGKAIGTTDLAVKERTTLQMLKRVYKGEPSYTVEGYQENYKKWTRIELIRLKGDKIALLIRDITQQKELENLRIAAEETAERTRLIDILMHDIQSPLTSFSLSLYMVQKLIESFQIPQELKDKALRSLGNAQTTSERMRAMMRSMVEFSKLDQQVQIQMSLINFSEYLQKLFMTEIEPLSQSKGQNISLKIDCNKECQVIINPVYFARVIINIVSNAISYTSEGGSIQLRLGAEAGNAILEIEDNGVGIPEEALAKIFLPFFRVDNNLEVDNGNAGLGLASVKKIIDLHRAKISVQSKVGKGSLFRISLKLYSEE